MGYLFYSILLVSVSLSIFLREGLAAEIPFILPSQPELARLKTAVIVTNKGKIRFELFPKEAPWHVANFKYLADKNFYKNRPFHLFLADYIIQTGALRPSEKAKFAYTLPPEFSQLEHHEGSLGMARLPDDKNPERRSSGTQFHILLDYNHKMDGSYTVFGQAVEGMEVLQDLRKGDIILDLRVYVTDPS